jgi:cytochrome b subunit of formate dehydrogenase
MFRFLALIIILLTFGWIAVALKSRSVSLAAAGERLKGAGLNIVGSITGYKSITSKDFAQKLIFPVIVFCVLILGLTGIVPPVLFGVHLSGYLLMFHLVIGALFTLAVTIGAVIWAQQNLFNSQDWTEIINTFTGKESSDNRIELYKKLCFWGITIFSLPAVCSIVFSMYKIFGTHGQEFLLNLHRYSTLVILILTVIYTFLLKFYSSEKS